MAKICEETNWFAEEHFAQRDADEEDNNWRQQLASSEFLAHNFMMGLTQKTNLKDHWSSDEIHSSPFFGKYMTRDRFLAILRFLHLNDNSNRIPRGEEGYNPLLKLRPVYDTLQEKFLSVYTPTKHLSLDESSIGWKGHIHFRVYNPKKAHKFHVKAYVLAEAESGYVSRFEIYTGKQQEISENGATYDAVMNVVSEHLNAGYFIFMDNYYSGVKLYDELRDQDTVACGTVRSNRKNLPEVVTKKKLKKGEVAAAKSQMDGEKGCFGHIDRTQCNRG